MKLSKWAKQQGISYMTAFRWFHSNKMPVNAYRAPSGALMVEDTKPQLSEKVVLYARVSSHNQKQDLERQIERLKLFASSQGLIVFKEIKEIGSGVNPNRKQFQSILKDPAITHIIVEHKDRLTRFGFEMLQSVLIASGRKITVINNEELKNDLVKDMIDILTSFCAKLYGQRGSKNRAQRALENIKNENNTK